MSIQQKQSVATRLRAWVKLTWAHGACTMELKNTSVDVATWAEVRVLKHGEVDLRAWALA